MFLDSLIPQSVRVGYGRLGLHGSLGYEGKPVKVGGLLWPHALSAHAPARLLFRVGGAYSSFRSQVALNDDVPAGASHATFTVLADGRPIATEPFVRAGDPPRRLSADIRGVDQLELVAETGRWEFCHSVWLDPEVGAEGHVAETFTDCLSRSEIVLPADPIVVNRCIATVVSPGFEWLLDDMLGSLAANGNCHDAQLVVFVLNGNDLCEDVARKYGARIVRCQSRTRINPMSKAIMYSVARVVHAEAYLCLDADMLVLGDLSGVFAAIDACPEGSILACREGNDRGRTTLADGLRGTYRGTDEDLRYLDVSREEAAYPLVVNDGIFAGGRTALLALDGAIRSMPRAASWADGNPRVLWRNQFVFNLALARLNSGVELDASFNVQLHVHDVDIQDNGVRFHADWRGKAARVLHFSGGAKRKYPAWQGHYARITRPLAPSGGGDGYAAFLGALRAWIGRFGMDGLAWSFYGLADGNGAHVQDSSTFPLLATLHYLVRSNGCTRVIETGTARGISAACIASAVAHREEGRVVTLDPYLHPGREELWRCLPESQRRCIEARSVDSIAGMKDAIDRGERYDAALLDSLHTEQQVWAEFQQAVSLVSPGGLILIHDASNVHGTVGHALRRIEEAGYGVVRLWSNSNGTAEDDHLGLALITNSR